MRSGRLAGLAAVLLGAFLAHAVATGHGFVYDDHRFVEHNAAIRSLADPARFFTDPGTASAAQGVEPDVWRPLRTLLYAAQYAAFGLAPRGWHVVGLLVHLLNAALVYRLLLRVLAPAPPGPAGEGAAPVVAAAAGALLFAVHPVTVEAVAWVSSLGDLVAWSLALVALLLSTRPGAAATAGVVVLGTVACLAKESAVVLFALVPLLRSALPADARPGRRETALRAGLLLAATVGYLVVRGAVLRTPADLPPLAQIDFPDGSRAAAVRAFLAAVVWYARALVLPTGFPFDRNAVTDPPPSSWGDPEVVLGAAILVALALAALRGLRRPRSVAPFAAGGALAVLVPVAGVLVPLKAFAALRFLYPALPGLAAGLVAAGAAAVAGRPRARVVALAAAAVAVVLLGVGTHRRSEAWADEGTLWTAVLRADPMNPRAHEGLGFERLREGSLDRARRATESEPDRLRRIRDHLDRGQRALRTYQEFQPYDGKVRAQNVAALRRLYDELRAAVVPSESTDRIEDVKIPSWVLKLTITEARAAMEAWERRGLTRGRGDEALRRATLEAWRGAALDLGDVVETLRVNALLAEADRRARGEVAYGQRRVPPLVAGMVLGREPARDGTPPARDLERRRARATVLAAAGLDPNLSDLVAWDALLPQLDALLRERPDDHALRRQRIAGLLLRVDGLPADDAARALEVLERDLSILLASSPGDRRVAQALEAVRARRGGRR
ncbi:MAG: hypothetical protein U1E39_17965 [Planctomycetota bacterium]